MQALFIGPSKRPGKQSPPMLHPMCRGENRRAPPRVAPPKAVSPPKTVSPAKTARASHAPLEWGSCTQRECGAVWFQKPPLAPRMTAYGGFIRHTSHYELKAKASLSKSLGAICLRCGCLDSGNPKSPNYRDPRPFSGRKIPLPESPDIDVYAPNLPKHARL